MRSRWGKLSRRSAVIWRPGVTLAAIHQNSGPKTFGDISNAGMLVFEGHKELLKDDFAQVTGSSAATVAEFPREASSAGSFTR